MWRAGGGTEAAPLPPEGGLENVGEKMEDPGLKDGGGSGSHNTGGVQGGI